MNNITIYLLHGAGAGHTSEFLTELNEQLSSATGLEVKAITLSYMKTMEETLSRRPPPKFEKLVDEVKGLIPSDEPCIIIGKSMGARIATQLTVSHNVKGVVCFGFPFYPARKTEKHRLSYLAAVTKPCLIFQGDRDTLGNQEWVEQQVLPETVDVRWVEGADHDFKRAKKYNTTLSQLLHQLSQLTQTWITKNCL
ncbi:hydrolase [Marinomonas mediterranea]|jgi:Predicted hydrolase of the alpha/beta-hydrolase fold|uniref:Putative hydrolase protein n=1 Tax=Marinomonas mediterranea (strain ATCC 700492 / JCM 21426 / NBRC 103028 / MMB-1) TaxID=717774 RepID=F2K4M1_MARM1|nr:alpha/beta family hydrolase [Marinomonas mediterranea]ADZ91414.1 putative hydrolase protein [Marinomonas mediterranea MMB-1]WCN13460.1 hydrolase [Marinomonas mediterranea]WCN17526.1 hydrolase [Marinomonas mediterranea MMB-1]